MYKSDERLYITEDELVSEAKTISIELNQLWEMQPFYLDEEKPLHQITVPHDPILFRQYLRIPNALLPSELQPEKLEHPPKFIKSKKEEKKVMRVIDKKETKEVHEDDMNVLNFVSEEEEDEGDYQAEKFEDFDQDDMSDDFGGSED